LLKSLGEVLHEFGFKSEKYWGPGSGVEPEVGKLYEFPAHITKYWWNLRGVIHAICVGKNDFGEPLFEFDRVQMGGDGIELHREHSNITRRTVVDDLEGTAFEYTYLDKKRLIVYCCRNPVTFLESGMVAWFCQTELSFLIGLKPFIPYPPCLRW